MAAVVPMADMARPIDEHEPEAFALRPTANDVVDPRRRHDDRPAPGYRGFGTPEQAHGATHLHAPHAASLEGSAPAKADDGGALAPAPVNALVVPAGDTISVATDARGVLDGVAHSLRTLAGRDAVDGPSVAIFPRGVDLLEVRMHISRDRDIDLNFRVAGPTPLSPSV
jgi:hypothetical protein